MSFDQMFSVFLYVFLAIFVATAILTLASLPGWVKIPDTYQKRLFASLILEVIGCVVGFVSMGVQIAKKEQSERPIAAILTASTWNWSYPDKNWRTIIHFNSVGAQLQFIAQTFFTRIETTLGADGHVERRDTDVQIFSWISDPFDPPAKGSRSVTFKCKWTVLSNNKAVCGPDAQYPGTYDTIIRLDLGASLGGTWQVPPNDKNPTMALQGGMSMTPTQEQ